jgi:hypothetical protein
MGNHKKTRKPWGWSAFPIPKEKQAFAAGEYPAAFFVRTQKRSASVPETIFLFRL